MHRLLLVDDDPINLAVLEEIFSETDTLCCTQSGEEALQRAAEFKPDLILLDIMMPHMDGFETCRRFKANPETAEIPVLFLTASTELKSKLTGFACGGADYITKPFEAEEVIARARTHLNLCDARELIRRHNHELETLLEERTHDLIQSERHAAFSLLMQGIIHNLKGPLTAVTGLSDFITSLIESKNDELSGGPTVLPVSESIAFLTKIVGNSQLISGAAEELKNMINSMMTKSASDKEKNLRETDLNALIRQELTFLEGDMRFKHVINKTIQLAEKPLTVRVVPSEMSQIISNLIRNAMDATYTEKQPKILIASGKKGKNAWLSIEDDGPGIPLEIRDRIFDPFFTTKPRADKAANQEPTGTGLGLYTVAAIVNTYGGRVNVGESPLGGAQVRIFIPLKTAQSTDQPPQKEPPKYTGST